MKITEEILRQTSKTGQYLVVQLKSTHRQDGCSDVPAMTKGVIKGGNKRTGYVFVFPHTVLNERKDFSDGDVRIVGLDQVMILGRVGV